MFPFNSDAPANVRQNLGQPPGEGSIMDTTMAVHIIQSTYHKIEGRVFSSESVPVKVRMRVSMTTGWPILQCVSMLAADRISDHSPSLCNTACRYLC